MTTPAAPVSRRDRPAKVPLTRELIVRTGLKVLDRDGMDALTMRRVAQELDTGAASLYVYVRNREDLLTAMLDEALADVVPPASRRGSWRKRLTALIEAAIAAMSRHQGLALVSMGAMPVEPNALLIVDRMIALLKEAELDEITISWAVDLLYLYIGASAAEHSVHQGRAALGGTEASSVSSAAERFAALSADRYPMVVAMREQLLSGDGDQRARWALKVLVNGILATPAE